MHREEAERLKEEILKERDRREEERLHWIKEADQIRHLAKERQRHEVERIAEEMEDMQRMLHRRHANELSNIKAGEEGERREWERKVKERMEKDWKEREDGLRVQYTKERNLEIDKVIERLEAEMKRSRADMERSAEARLARINAKHDSEVAELAKEIGCLNDRAADLKRLVGEREGENLMLASVAKQNEVEMGELRAAKERLLEERADLAGAVRGEFAGTIDQLTEQNTKLSAELHAMIVGHKSELLRRDIDHRKAELATFGVF